MRIRRFFCVLSLVLTAAAWPAGAIRSSSRQTTTAIFTDWTAVDTGHDVAQGTLNGVAVTVSGGDLDFGVTDDSSPAFSYAFFDPALPLSDLVGFRAPTSGLNYTITFAAPITNPILHVFSLASTLRFHAASITKLSGQDDFTVSGNIVQGAYHECCPNDANGTVQLNGEFTVITFTAIAPPEIGQGDGVGLQIGILDSDQDVDLMLFDGFLEPYPAPPLTAVPTFKAGRTIPLKWVYRLDGNVVDSAAANPVLSLVGPSDCGAMTGEPLSIQDTDGPSGLAYHAADMTWTLTWSTKPYPAGCYWIKVDSASPFGDSAFLPIALKK